MLGVLPLHQDQLAQSVGAAVHEGGVDAGAVRAADASSARGLAEEVGRADVLERQEAAGLDLQHPLDAEQRTESPLDTAGVAHHLAQSVRALDLRRQQVVARAAARAGVPGDALRCEQRQHALADLR